jgi:hypothetical protein
MTDEERKAWEELVERGKIHAKYYPKDTRDDRHAILAADTELKRLREAVKYAEEVFESDCEYSYLIELRRRAKEG